MPLAPPEPMPKTPKSKPAPEPEPSGRKPMVVQIRGSQEYKDWVEAFAEKEGFSVSMLFDRAVRKYARDAGQSDPPKR